MRGQPDAAQDVNKHWLGEVQPVGIVVTAGALAEQALVPAQQSRLDSEAVRELLRGDDESAPALRDPWSFFSEVLDWRPSQVAGSPNGPEIPDALRIVLPASETVLEPQLAVMTPDKAGWQILVRCEASGVEPDARGSLPGWEATPHQRLERLLRDTGVPTGILLTDDALRLVHAPANGESSGWFSVPLRALGTTAGRTMLGALKLLLDRIRLFNDAESRRLPALLMASRRAQASVSATLATQVLGALHDLLRGLHAAAPEATASLARQRPEHLYEGLLAVLMRLVFLLYAEDRGLIPSRDDPASRTFYEANYGVRGLHARLGDDAALHPDTMDERRGAWHQLLVLFHLVHTGDGSGWMRGRGGKLFDPASFPFLQGQDAAGDPVRVPPVSDGCVLRILDGLLLLKGERLSYRALDVEQIGSVYETVMGFTAEPAAAASIAIEAGKRNRTPVFVDLSALLAQPGKERGTWLKTATERGKFPPKVEKALAAAKDEAALAAALGEVFDKRGSPDARVWPAGTPLLQPTDERRRTGSHYTPRDLTGPIVRHALEPAFTRIGPAATPQDVLSLKICDPAMGSGAFLVEACRQLGARLVEAWRLHEDNRPVLPPDEDEELHARRLVAQRCLYGVDRNHMAVDLARLSLWLATLARDHEFTFLDHALRCGDSLVGLSRAQVERLDWAEEAQPSLFGSFVSGRLERAAAARSEIRTAGDDVTLFEQERRQALAEKELADLRRAGNAAVAQFFGHDKDKARRAALDRLHEAGLDTARLWTAIDTAAATLRAGPHPLQPFHWELEFPEVFFGDAPGFDAIVGNPPFLGGKRISTQYGDRYAHWLQTLHPDAHGNADLVAHFVRRAFALLRQSGCFGLIATNTVGQGDTRESGLCAILAAGGSVLRAIRRLPWPGEAAVVVSVVHVVRGGVRWPVLDGREVRRISAYLVEGDLDASPARLVANEGQAFIGCFLLGMGFTFDEVAVTRGRPASSVSEMHRLIAKDPRNAERIFPYLGGEEVNTNPSQAHHRWCIDFNDFPLRREAGSKSWAAMAERERAACRRKGLVPLDYPEPVASDWPDLLEIIDRLVKPERDLQKRDAIRERWWQYADKRPGLRQAISGLKNVIVASLVSQRPIFAIVPNGAVFSHKLAVIASESQALHATLSSRTSEVWIRSFTSTMKDDLNYSPSDCFENFPFLQDAELSAVLEEASTNCHGYRASLIAKLNQGLTTLYNRFHDPDERGTDISRLRDLHHIMDQAVLRSYGWHDLADTAAPEFLTEDIEPEERYRGRLFWPAPFRDEVLARLLTLNAERAAGERTRGFAPGPVTGELEDA